MQLVRLAHLFILMLAACSSPTPTFDKQVWLKHADPPDETDLDNPRRGMIDDLTTHYLKPGMSRKAVLNLLGKPVKEGVEYRLPKGVILPDSLELTNAHNFKSENQKQALARFNEFYHSHSQPDTLMHYPIGWNTFDPISLVVKLDGNGKVGGYWVE